MGDVVNILEKQAHNSGYAKCLHCGHEWMAVAPVGVFAEMKCPSCSFYKGCFIGTTGPETYWQCGCGCDIFRLSPKDVLCINCGAAQNWCKDT